MKICYHCKQSKPDKEFNKDNHKTDGLYSYCMTCCRPKSTEWNTLNKDKARAKVARYYAKHKEKIISKQKIRHEKYPPIRRARWMVAEAIKAGRLLIEPCAVCRATESVQGHHEDYTKPLRVLWLCASHHTKIHNNMTPTYSATE